MDSLIPCENVSGYKHSGNHIDNISDPKILYLLPTDFFCMSICLDKIGRILEKS